LLEDGKSGRPINGRRDVFCKSPGRTRRHDINALDPRLLTRSIACLAAFRWVSDAMFSPSRAVAHDVSRRPGPVMRALAPKGRAKSNYSSLAWKQLVKISCGKDSCTTISRRANDLYEPGRGVSLSAQDLTPFSRTTIRDG
jgi:hypothetical protein